MKEQLALIMESAENDPNRLRGKFISTIFEKGHAEMLMAEAGGFIPDTLNLTPELSGKTVRAGKTIDTLLLIYRGMLDIPQDGSFPGLPTKCELQFILDGLWSMPRIIDKNHFILLRTLLSMMGVSVDED